MSERKPAGVEPRPVEWIDNPAYSDQLPDVMVSVTVPEGFVTFRVKVSPALKVTGKPVPSVKLPSGLIVPVATTVILCESVMVIAAAATGQTKG